MKTYVQTRNGHFVTPNCFDVFYGLNKLGIEVIPYDWDADPEFATVELNKENAFIGYINFFYAALDKLHIRRPQQFDLPDELKEFFGRKIWHTTMGEIRKEGVGNIFIKPLNELKLFRGHVINGNVFRDYIYTAGVNDDENLIASEVVEFVSEYRNFVLHNKLIDSRRYRGDLREPLDYDVVENAIWTFEKSGKAPASYCIDFGKTKDGRTLLIECNDGFSFGTYGLEPIFCAKMVLARWEEIVAETNSYST